MEKAKTTRAAAMAAAVLLCVLLAAAQEVAAVETKTIQYPHISCKVLGNCDKKLGPDATRPGKPANKYTRGCSAIDRCRG